MGNTIVLNSTRFIFLLIFQVLVFNKINLFGYVNPYPYLLYILLFPAVWNTKLLLLSAFFLGYWIDLSLDSGGVHALASIVVAYNRKRIFNLFFGATYENQTLDLTKPSSLNMYKYILFMILIHHFILFTASILSFTHTFDILGRTVMSTTFTFLLVFLMLVYYKRNR